MARPKTVIAAAVWKLAWKGLGTEDIFVALRQYGVTKEYIRTAVFEVEANRLRKKAKKKVA